MLLHYMPGRCIVHEFLTPALGERWEVTFTLLPL